MERVRPNNDQLDGGIAVGQGFRAFFSDTSPVAVCCSTAMRRLSEQHCPAMPQSLSRGLWVLGLSTLLAILKYGAHEAMESTNGAHQRLALHHRHFLHV